MNLKPAVLKNFVFDWEVCFRVCEVYLLQNLVGLELPFKHTVKVDNRSLSFLSVFEAVFFPPLPNQPRQNSLVKAINGFVSDKF